MSMMVDVEHFGLRQTARNAAAGNLGMMSSRLNGARRHDLYDSHKHAASAGFSRLSGFHYAVFTKSRFTTHRFPMTSARDDVRAPIGRVFDVDFAMQDSLLLLNWVSDLVQSPALKFVLIGVLTVLAAAALTRLARRLDAYLGNIGSGRTGTESAVNRHPLMTLSDYGRTRGLNLPRNT
jgi:hypothetical protein